MLSPLTIALFLLRRGKIAFLLMTLTNDALTIGRPLRLLTIGHSYVVSANRNLTRAMQAVGGKRWQLTVAAPTFFHGHRDLRPVTLHKGKDEPCPLVALPARLTRFVHLFHYGRGLRQLLRMGWDMVHCWEEPFVVAGAQIARALPRDTPFVFRTAQSLDKKYPPPFAQMERYVLRRATGWICSSHTVAKNLSARRGYDALPMAQIPLGVDTRRFYPDRQAGRSVISDLGWLPSGEPIVGYLGRFTAEKGLRTLMQALECLAKPWRALFVGAGPLHREIGRWAARFPNRVRICTEVHHDDVPRFLNAMDVLCAPSQTTPRWREQFGRMLIEAFACGIPVIGSDSGEIPHVIRDTGRIVAELDVPAWRDAIADLLENFDERRRLSAEGRARALLEYDWPIVGRRHLEFFSALLSGKNC